VAGHLAMTEASEWTLNAVEARVLGALMEKESTTPDYYPLSLNALLNACNQKSSREPVMTLTEDDLRQAVHALQNKGLVASASGADSRVAKYEHRLQEVFNFNRRESALLCLLLLRGPQTPGELRARSERLYRFDEIGDVLSTLQKLGERQPPLVKVLPRQAGTKESRYAHLLSGDVDGWEAPPDHMVSGEPARRPESGYEQRIGDLEEQVATLRQEVSELKQQMEQFRALMG
jgi:uncharacterized protein YceH (UPF0502 family)